MFNKENLRKAMERDFNKDKIYNEIVQKMERGSNVNKVLKYSLIPICFIVIVGGVFIFNNNSNKFHDSPTIDYSMMNENRNIYINRVDGFNNLLDIDGKAEDITLKEISEIYPEIENVNIPSNLKNARNIKMYSRKDLTDDYTTLDGYNAMYVNEDEGNEITKSMEIFMSRTLEEKGDVYQLLIILIRCLLLMEQI